MKKRLVFPLSILILFSCLSTTQAWNKPGHMVIGAIAFYELKQRDPVALASVINLLKQNPDYASKWVAAINNIQDNDPDKHDLYLFMYAARWPDDVRGTPLHCEKCHYINYPYKPPGQPNNVVPQPADPQNIIQAFNQYRYVTEHNYPAARKAQALCWIFHLVGDVHQPLHTTALFTSMFPQGDRGATRFYIRADEEAGTQSLHSFWDELIIKTDRFSSVRSRARSLRGRSDLQRNVLGELAEIRFEKWASAESFEAAKRYGYLSGALVGSRDEEDGAVLPDNYAAPARRVAERREVVAGYRLADHLSTKF